VRDRIGQREDRFSATVFLGSGLLFVAMLLVAMLLVAMLLVASAVTAGFLADATARRGAPQEISGLGRRVGAVVLHIYAMRMATGFTVSTATIGLRTGFMPRWLGFSGYAIALVLLLAIDVTPWSSRSSRSGSWSSAPTPSPRASGGATSRGIRTVRESRCRTVIARAKSRDTAAKHRT
jgi:hypothetical protein